jgi:alkylation response protein AidB-like acyl-CoA dehydrogenase
MDFGFTPEQEMIRGQAVEFFRRECPTAVVRGLMESEQAHSEQMWWKMAELGWTGLVFPEEFGGAGLSMVELSIVLEEMGRALAPGTYFSTVVLGGLLLQAAASEQQKRRWLTPICTGELKATLALFEEHECQGPIRVWAENIDGGFVISGKKFFVPDAEVADLIICAAKTNSAKDRVTLFAVDRTREGVNITPLRTMDETRRLYEVSFESVRVDESCVIGCEGGAWPVIEHALDLAAIGLSAQMVGGARRVLEMCVEYLKTREQFGRKIGSFQSLQHRSADMLLLTESAKSAVYAASCAASDGARDLPVLASIAKAYASDAYLWIAGEGIQLHGGMGFTWEHDVHLYFKRACADASTLGDATHHRKRLAGLIGLG